MDIIVELDGTVTKVKEPIGPYVQSRGLKFKELYKPIERHFMT